MVLQLCLAFVLVICGIVVAALATPVFVSVDGILFRSCFFPCIVVVIIIVVVCLVLSSCIRSSGLFINRDSVPPSDGNILLSKFEQSDATSLSCTPPLSALSKLSVLVVRDVGLGVCVCVCVCIYVCSSPSCTASSNYSNSQTCNAWKSYSLMVYRPLCFCSPPEVTLTCHSVCFAIVVLISVCTQKKTCLPSASGLLLFVFS